MKTSLQKLSPAESLWMDSARNVIVREHKAFSTEDSYLYYLHKYLLFLRGIVNREASSEEKFGAFLTLMAEDGCSKSTHKVAFNAIRWFYESVRKQELAKIDSLRVKGGKRVRYAPGFDDTMRFLAAVRDSQTQPYRLIIHMLYGMGLRLNEVMDLRIRNIDLDPKGPRIFIREGKHDKDRIVRIPVNLIDPLRHQIGNATRVWEWDRRQPENIPVPMPGLLGRKWPKAPYSLNWFWLFPAEGYCQHRRTGETFRWRLHHGSVQKAARRAATAIGMDGLITPHCLRHSFATHALSRGNNIKAIADWMGHANINTTSGYIHAHLEEVIPPITSMPVLLPVTVPENIVAFHPAIPHANRIQTIERWARKAS